MKEEPRIIKLLYILIAIGVAISIVYMMTGGQ